MRSLFRIFKFAGQGFFRNFWLSLVTITMMLMAVLSVTLLLGIDYIKQATISGVEQKVDMLLSIRYEVDVEVLDNFVTELEDLVEVRDVRVITPEENRELFLSNNAGNRAGEALDIFAEDENPFSYSLAIQAYDLDQYSVIGEFVAQEKYNEIVETSTFNDYQTFIDRIDVLAKNVNKYSWYLTGAFILISIIVIFNTIRISIYSRKEEIVIMKLVGASPWFIRLPFLLESTFYALIAVLIVIAIVYPLLDFIQPQLNAYFQSDDVINISGYFRDNFIPIFVLQFVVLSVLNIISTAIAIRRYLKV